MAVPIIDFNQFVINHLPPTKRKPKWIAWLQGAISSLSRQDFIFRGLKDGSTDLGYYSSIITYAKGNTIRTEFGIVYESQQDNNIAEDVLDVNWWLPILDYFVGLDEQAQYTCQKLVFEYALNRKFQKTLTDNAFVGFKNPVSITTGGYLPLSDIYISGYVPAFFSFTVFSLEPGTSPVFTNNTEGFAVFSDEHLSGTTSYVFSINIPNSVYLALGTTNSIRDSVIRNFSDRICRSGITYNIITY